MSTVLILGGGTGGIVAANVLRKTLGTNHKVVLIDRKDSHVFMGAWPLLMVNKRKPQDLIRRLDRLQKKGINFIKAEIMSLHADRSLVHTDQGALEYDYLIISLGAEQHPETVPGFLEGAYNIYNFNDLAKLSKRLKGFHKGKIVLFISSIPFICPPAPYEMVFLLDDYFRQRGIREKIELSLITPETSPAPLARPVIGQSLRRMMEQRQIGLTTEAKVLSLDLSTRSLILDQGIHVPGDLFLGVPSHWGPAALRHTGLVMEGGWVEVDPHTLETKNKGVFAIGDNTALRLPVMKTWAPKAGIFAHYQAEVVARNLALIIKGKKPRFRYTGKGGCIMFTGFGRARYSSVHYYAQPRPSITLFRPTRAAYWAKIAFEKYWLRFWF